MLQVCGIILQITGVTNRASRGVSAMKQNEVPENVKVTACIARPAVSMDRVMEEYNKEINAYFTIRSYACSLYFCRYSNDRFGFGCIGTV